MSHTISTFPPTLGNLQPDPDSESPSPDFIKPRFGDGLGVGLRTESVCRQRGFGLTVNRGMADEDPLSPLSLSQNSSIAFYISTDHKLATRVDDVYSVFAGWGGNGRKDGRCCIGFVL